MTTHWNVTCNHTQNEQYFALFGPLIIFHSWRFKETLSRNKKVILHLKLNCVQIQNTQQFVRKADEVYGRGWVETDQLRTRYFTYLTSHKPTHCSKSSQAYWSSKEILFSDWSVPCHVTSYLTLIGQNSQRSVGKLIRKL